MANLERGSANLRVPPQAVEAERAVLGCVLIDPNAISTVAQILNVDSFYDSINKIIYENMLLMFDQSKEIDNISLIEQLKKTKTIESVGGAFFITGLSNDAPTASNVEYYAKIVKDKYILRTIINSSISMSELAYESSLSSIEILDKTEQELFSLSQDAKKGIFVSIEPLLHEVLDNWSTRKKDGVLGIPSGFIYLDELLSGFQKSDLIICAGRPSMGKTAFALNLARNIGVDYGYKVGVFSLEMANKQLTERFITSEAMIDSHLVRTGNLPKNEWKKLSSAADVLSETKIFIDDSPGLNIMEIRAKARQLKQQKDIDIIIIDYIQLLHSGSRVESRQQEISMISRSLKALAKELDIPIIALSQLSRAVENRTDHRPVMSDLRESGAIEQDADVIMFIYRKYVYSKDEEDKGLGQIIVAKHRNGPTGVVDVAFIDKYAKFQNLDYSTVAESDTDFSNM